MARAFIASIPLGIVLVAALVVPLAVIPGTFGFQSWPASRGGVVLDRPVHETPDGVKIVQRREQRPTPARRAPATTKPGHSSTTPTSQPTAPRRQTVAYVTTPGHRGPTRHGSGGNGSGRGPGDAPAPSSPSAPANPSTPSSEPEQPGAQPDPGQIAGGDTPVLRDEPVPAPAPPAPVEPVTPTVPSPPQPEDDGDDGDHGEHGRNPVRDIVHGLGLGREHGHGNGHGNGHGYGHDGHDGHE